MFSRTLSFFILQSHNMLSISNASNVCKLKDTGQRLLNTHTCTPQPWANTATQNRTPKYNHPGSAVTNSRQTKFGRRLIL